MPYQNQNRDTTQELKEAAGLSELTGYPRKIADAVVPVINVNPKDYKIIDFFLKLADGETYTILEGQKLYISNILVKLDTEAESDCNANLTFDRDGETIYLFNGVIYSITDGFTGDLIDVGINYPITYNYPVVIKSNEVLEVAGGSGAKVYIYGWIVNTV